MNISLKINRYYYGYKYFFKKKCCEYELSKIKYYLIKGECNKAAETLYFEREDPYRTFNLKVEDDKVIFNDVAERILRRNHVSQESIDNLKKCV